jgi:hypothetical protein
MFLNKQIGEDNKDLRLKDLNYYLELTKDFKSSFKDFVVKDVNGFNVIDESVSNPVGAKARFGEMLIKSVKEEEIVYVQPRRGFAGISLSYLCKKYGKKLTLVMPSSKEASEHQRLCIEYGAKPLFVRIAAMPNANRIAKKYAEKTGAFFVPLGLDHELVTANAVRCVHDFFKDKEKPKVMWTVISTGVLTRALQIALPDTEFKAVAVARNVQQGELGKAEFFSYHKPFNSKSDYIPKEFDCESSYDSKGFDYMLKFGNKGDWFFSVAGDADKPKLQANSIDSYRDWGDLRDFEVLNNS